MAESDKTSEVMSATKRHRLDENVNRAGGEQDDEEEEEEEEEEEAEEDEEEEANDEARCELTLAHDAIVTAVAISRDESLIGTGSLKGARVWDRQGTLRKTYSPRKKVYCVAFSSSYFAYGLGKSIEIIQLTNLSPFTSVTGHNELVVALEFSPNSQILASGSSDEKIGLWNCTANFQRRAFLEFHDVQEFDPEQLVRFTSRGHTEEVRSVSFSHDGRFLVSGGLDSTIQIWDIPSKRCIAKHQLGVICLDVAFFQDSSNHIFAGLWKALPRMYNRDAWQDFLNLNFPREDDADIIRAVACTSTKLFCGVSRTLDIHPPTNIRVSRAPGRRPQDWVKPHSVSLQYFNLEGVHLGTLSGHTGSITSLKASSDGTWLVSGSCDRTAKVWIFPA